MSNTILEISTVKKENKAGRLSWTKAKCWWLIVARSDLPSRWALLCDPGNVGSRLAGKALLTRGDCLIHLEEVLYGTYWSRKVEQIPEKLFLDRPSSLLSRGDTAPEMFRMPGGGGGGDAMGFVGWWSEKIILLHHCYRMQEFKESEWTNN